MAEYIITLTAVRFTILKPEYEHFHFILTHKCAMMKEKRFLTETSFLR